MTDDESGRGAFLLPPSAGWAARLREGLWSTWVPVVAILLHNAYIVFFVVSGAGAGYSGTLVPFLLAPWLLLLGFVGIWLPRVGGALALVAYGLAVVATANWADWEFAAFGAVHPLLTGAALYVGLLLLAARRAEPRGRRVQAGLLFGVFALRFLLGAG